MDILGIRRCAQWLIILAFVTGCGSTTPAPKTASPSVPTLTPSATPASARSLASTHTANAALAAATLTATAPPATQAEPTAYWPTEGWRTASPEEQGMDSARLEQMLDVIDDEQLGVHSVLVARNGYIVAENYYPPYEEDTKHQLYSVTKSFISALIGIAITEGYIDGIDHRILDFFPGRTFSNLDTPKQAMTLEHLLTMTPGLDWEEGPAIYQELSRARDWVQLVLDRPMVAEPGSEFNYCSGCSHVMSAIIQETTGMNTLAYARDRLFEPLGIKDVHWELDGSGIPNGGWGLDLTPRDMAKFGYLYLNDGVWDGKQIVPAEWIRDSVERSVEFDDGWGYGYQWWLYPSYDAYSAVGLGAQLIVVIPDSELVVVFTAALADKAALFELIENYIVAAD